ncbi:TetR/AcrR family transcriptional regulator [Aeromicrobium terrae]|uniref:TetR/AcrR family transcriptional regulator n=1 Tax=Aeromicrobium terrae TaxID=2498846 RepID=UPI001650C5DB|nr:TetR/AcrR family transcriptional regulator [Aeromicrobium terrae]
MEREAVEEKRAYDATRRRERASQQRSETRDRVLAAAEERFLADGYAGTRMTEIAATAGVSLATVYAAGRSKGELIQQVIQRATAGVPSDDPLEEPPEFDAAGRPALRHIAAENEPERQVELIADRISGVLERISPLWAVLRDAASVDETAATSLENSLKRRLVSLRAAIGMIPGERLRGDLREATDTLWALSSPEIYLMLRTSRRWSHARYRAWLRETLRVQLLTAA